MTYPVIKVEQDWILVDEPMGTKEKFWCDIDGVRWLFKHTRINEGFPTGEDWAEKIAREIAISLGIPCATVELAEYNGLPGTVSRDFTRLTQNHNIPIVSHMMHGNELLHKAHDDAYPNISGRTRNPDHTIERVISILNFNSIHLPAEFQPDPLVSTPADVFCGYLLLDAIIGNTDRHHENWAIQYIFSGVPTGWYLCPSFDHASSLGRELTEERRHLMIHGHDANTRVRKYAERCSSALYLSPEDPRPLSPIQAFCESCSKRVNGGKYWTNRLHKWQPDTISTILNQIPDTRATQLAKELAYTLVVENVRRLLEATS